MFRFSTSIFVFRSAFRYFLAMVVFLGVASRPVVAQEIGENITERLKQHVEYLADDRLKGRMPGTEGGDKAAEYIRKQFRKIGLIPKGGNGNFYQPFRFTYNPTSATDPHASPDSARTYDTQNVVGFIDNEAQMTIVIGAHYDHLGIGKDGNSLDASPVGKIHNGADDNASGVAGLIELARYFHDNDRRERYNFLFVAFSGEEEGLMGSRYFVEHTPIALEKMNCMMNMDMIGRMKDRQLLVYGTGTAANFEELIKFLDFKQVKIKTDSSGIGPSDHTSFYLRSVPVLHFFTGAHSDYHKPSDDADKINYRGMKEVLNVMISLINVFNDLPRLKFQETRTKQTESPRFTVTLGIMPDYGFDGRGVRADGILKDRPAERAGLQAGDIIVRLGENSVTNMQSYMEALAKFKKGDRTTVVVTRKDTTNTVDVQF